MIKSFYQIGRLYKDDPKLADYFQPWQNPYKTPEEKSVLVIDIVEKKLITPIRGPEVFLPNRLEKYLFREPAGPRGTHLTPTSFLYFPKKRDEQAESLDKFYDRLKRTFEQNRKLYGNYIDLNHFWENIKPAMESAIADLTHEGNLLITFRFDDKYPGEIPEIRALLLDEAYEKYKQTKKANFVANDQVCAVTGKRSDEVWGKIGLLGFTVDDEAFMRGGFDGEEAWKMFPVSSGIVPILEGARTLVFERLRFNLYSLRYLIVPKFIGWEDIHVKEAVDQLLGGPKTEKSQDTQNQAIINSEEYILRIIEDEAYSKAGVSFDVFFYEENQAQLLLKLHLSEIMPSRMRKIKEVKTEVEKAYSALLQKDIPGKGKKEDIIISYPLHFGNLKDYFSKVINKKTIFQPSFFKMLEAVFYRQQLPEEFVIRAFHEKVVDAFKNYNTEAWRFTDEGYRTFAFYQYLSQLGIFQSNPVQIMENQPVALTLDEFLSQPQHAEFFKEPVKKAAFLAGCLVERLLYVQRSKIKSEPFRKYLHSLQLDTSQLQKIMLKWEEKVQEYVRAGYIHGKSAEEWIDLKAQVFPGLLAGGEVKKQEFSYAFALGMVMQQAFTKEAIRLALIAKKEREAGEKKA